MKRQSIEDIRSLNFSRFSNAEIMEHFNGRCQICGSTYQISLHHIVFRSQGGLDGPRIPLCNHCHMRLHSEGGFRLKHEKKLLQVAGIFYQLKTQIGLF
jgi:5-methylcytosine-specific restriction endonuclease McrA